MTVLVTISVTFIVWNFDHVKENCEISCETSNHHAPSGEGYSASGGMQGNVVIAGAR